MMRVPKVLLALVVVAGLVGAGVLVYDATRPYSHPIKAAEAQKHGRGPTGPPSYEQTTDPRKDLFGPARVVDGDTLRVQDVEADLWTIVAPRLDQACEKDGKPWACGEASRAHLEKLIGGRQVACRPEGPPTPDGRWLGICYVADAPCQGDEGPCESSLGSLNLAQVRDGWAEDFEGQFSEDEEIAQAQKRGLWAGRWERAAAP
jgi:endonuclease YncB( thermonuclease family)